MACMAAEVKVLFHSSRYMVRLNILSALVYSEHIEGISFSGWVREVDGEYQSIA